MPAHQYSQSPSALDRRARRAAKRVQLVAVKTTWRRGTHDNYGGYQLLSPFTNWIAAGHRFDLSAEDVIEICQCLAE